MDSSFRLSRGCDIFVVAFAFSSVFPCATVGFYGFSHHFFSPIGVGSHPFHLFHVVKFGCCSNLVRTLDFMESTRHPAHELLLSANFTPNFLNERSYEPRWFVSEFSGQILLAIR